jgi:hypothetical protein
MPQKRSLLTYCILWHFSRWGNDSVILLTWDIEQLHIEDHWRSRGNPWPATMQLVFELQTFHFFCIPTSNIALTLEYSANIAWKRPSVWL